MPHRPKEVSLDQAVMDSGDAAALAGAFPTVSLQQLVNACVQQALDELRKLSAALQGATDPDR